MARSSALAVATLAALLASSSAWAQSAAPDARSSARALADEAADAFARGDPGRAHELLSRAYGIVPAPTIAVLDARSLVALGRWVEATEAYSRALGRQLPPDAPPAFHRAVREAEAELRGLESRIPRLHIQVQSPAGDPVVRVLVDGTPLAPARLGAPIPLDPGTHTVRAEFRRQRVVSESVSLAAGKSSTLVLEPPQPPGNRTRTWSFVSFGAGASSVVVGLVTGKVALDAREEADRRCDDRRCERGSAGADALGRFRTYRTVSTVSYVLGAAGVGLGTILFFGSSEGEGPGVALAPTLNGVQVRGTL